MKRTCLVCALAVHLLVPVDTNAQTPDQQALRATGPLADSLREIAIRMVELLRNRDSRGAVALYGDTSHFVHIDDGAVIPWSRLAPMMRSYLDSVNSNPLYVVGEPGVTLVDNNNAVLYVAHRFEGGEGRGTHEGVWTGVLHRFAGGWKIVHSHSSDRTTR